MDYRRLGSAGLKVSVLSYGSWVTYGKQLDADAAGACMKAAWEEGVNFFDNAEAYEAGRCDVFTTDVSQLYAEKLKLTVANYHVILPEVISKEPLGPLVRHGDDQWFDVVKWVNFAMLNAEELGVSSKNVDEAMKSNQPEIRRLLGVEGNYGEQLGLTKDWVVRILKQVGNYGEVFERNVGTGSRLGISRGLNRLWTKGGIQYAPPIR